LFRDIQRIFHFNPEIAYCAFEFGMAQEELNRPDFSCLSAFAISMPPAIGRIPLKLVAANIAPQINILNPYPV
jgi:hypothetical protein